MKYIGYIFMIVGLIGCCLIPSQINYNTYCVSANVISIKDKQCTLKDTKGNFWIVENDTLKLYGRYVLTIDNNGTEKQYEDDVIMEVK